jgi:long-chain acyl-CoA synthetase
VLETSMPVIVPADPSANVTDLLVDRVAQTPDRALFSVPDGSGGWRDISARAFHDEVVALAKGFIAAGVQPGDKVGFLAKTTYQWSVVDFALFFAGAVMVPVYETNSPSQIQWTLSDSGATSLMVETAEHVSRFDQVRDELPLIREVWQMDDGAIDALKETGTGIADEEVERRRALANGDDVATLIYTSG